TLCDLLYLPRFPTRRSSDLFVGRFAPFEREVVGENNEALVDIPDLVDDLRQPDQIVLIDLNHPQALLEIFIQQRLDQRGHASPKSEEHTSELQSRENLVCHL